MVFPTNILNAALCGLAKSVSFLRASLNQGGQMPVPIIHSKKNYHLVLELLISSSISILKNIAS